MSLSSNTLGDHLRTWRQRRHLSQLDLALDADISTRHLSFMETGRASPSRDMVLRLAERLEVPLRERNTLLVAAGFAPVFPQRDLDHPALTAARKAVDLILTGHEPFPALAVDRGWNLVAANRAVAPLDGIAMPLEIHVGDKLLSFLATTTVFGTATEVTLAELTLETFFPANAETAAAIQAMASGFV